MLLIRHKCFIIKMDKGSDILDHINPINKVKSIADQLTCLQVPMKEEDVVMTLFVNLPPLFNHFITVLEMRPRLDIISARLMHEVSNKENEPQ